MSIKDSIVRYIRDGESVSQGLGLEIEHFVVNDAGVQIEFHEVSSIIEKMAGILNAKIIYMDGYPVGYVTDDYSITLEPACQFEISINPYSDIETIKSIYEDFVTLWTPVLKARGYHLETKGNLPLVEQGVIEPDDIALSPKKRYKYMDSYFRHSGRYGKHMMRASASTQVSVDFRSEEDMVRKLNVLQKISPILMIAMENKTDPDSTLKEHPDKPHLFRIQEWDDLDPSRTGFYPHSLEEGFGYDSVADTILHTPLILLTDDGVTTDVGSETAEDLFARGLIREETLDITRERSLIEHFISMGFFHYRVKKYIEIRVADSVPIDRALGYVALLKGIVYSDDNLIALEKELADIDTAEKIQQAVEDIERDGYNAVVYGRKASEWAAHLYELAIGRLTESDKEYLENVRAFWGIS
jgi:glutamate--cysteine ligase